MFSHCIFIICMEQKQLEYWTKEHAVLTKTVHFVVKSKLRVNIAPYNLVKAVALRTFTNVCQSKIQTPMYTY